MASSASASSPRSGQGSPGAAGLLRGSRARSYGSLVSSPVRERRLEHQLRPGDTLQGLAVMYGVTTEQIKRANRLYTNDSIFLKKTLLIPVPSKPKALSNGLDFEDEEGEEKEGGGEALPPQSTKKQKQPRKNGSSGGSVPKHDLSAADFLFKLDSEIRRSKQAAAKKLREGESGILGEAAGTSPTASYQGEPSPQTQQRALLGPVPLTRIACANTLLDQEDEIFKL